MRFLWAFLQGLSGLLWCLIGIVFTSCITCWVKSLQFHQTVYHLMPFTVHCSSILHTLHNVQQWEPCYSKSTLLKQLYHTITITSVTQWFLELLIRLWHVASGDDSPNPEHSVYKLYTGTGSHPPNTECPVIIPFTSADMMCLELSNFLYLHCHCWLTN